MLLLFLSMDCVVGHFDSFIYFHALLHVIFEFVLEDNCWKSFKYYEAIVDTQALIPLGNNLIILSRFTKQIAKVFSCLHS